MSEENKNHPLYKELERLRLPGIIQEEKKAEPEEEKQGIYPGGDTTFRIYEDGGMVKVDFGGKKLTAFVLFPDNARMLAGFLILNAGRCDGKNAEEPSNEYRFEMWFEEVMRIDVLMHNLVFTDKIDRARWQQYWDNGLTPAEAIQKFLRI